MIQHASTLHASSSISVLHEIIPADVNDICITFLRGPSSNRWLNRDSYRISEIDIVDIHETDCHVTLKFDYDNRWNSKTPQDILIMRPIER